jgi:hypothetical protein
LYQALLADARFHDLLLHCDRDLAAAARAKRCPLCGGRLDSSSYARKPRGRLVHCGPAHDRRFSLCCAVDGCRKRATPASLRFLGRRSYLAVVVVLVTAMQHGLTDGRHRRLQEVIGVSRRTVARWREWWLSRFTATPFWKMAAAAFMPPVELPRLPASLVERFSGEPEERLISVLRFLAPLTGRAAKRHAF